MLAMKTVMVLTMTLGLAACGTSYASRNLTESGPGVIGETEKPVVEAGMMLVLTEYNVARIGVVVPHTLRVSEANVFYPLSDIVWHGDPLGDRYEQVKTILEEGLAAGTAGMTTGREVEIDVQLTRFHALTPKTRYTTGGVHDTEFLLTVRDAATGEVIDGPRKVMADVHASGGQRALEEEAAGITQKSVIEGRIAEVIKKQLSERLVAKDSPEALALSEDGVVEAMPSVAEAPVVPVAEPAAEVSRDAFIPSQLPLVDWNGTLRAAI